MPNVSRVTALWTGFPGAPGYSKFSFIPLADDTARNAAGAAVKAFFDAIKAHIPGGTSIQVQPIVDDFDILTGKLMTTAAMPVVPAVTTATGGASPYAGGSGYAVVWLAPGVFDGKRIHGKTFIVPATGINDADGTIFSGALTTATAAGVALLAATGADLAVWNRTWTKPPDPRPKNWKREPINGILVSATGVTVHDIAAGLRSRRT